MNIFRWVAILLLLVTGGFVDSRASFSQDSPVLPEKKPDYSVMAGSWQRTDGGYLIKINNVQPDGRTDVAYFNPKPVHVAESNISTQNKLIKLFVQFQDAGYEGSTYTLYYYAAKDALVGFYYQAVLDQTFEVIFLRTQPPPSG